jgi:type II secretory pathway component PulF
MPIFEYQTKTTAGRKVINTIVADTPREARNQLRSQGVAVETISPVVGLATKHDAKSQSALGWMARMLEPIRYRRLMNSQVSWFTREMATLLRVGTPMVDAVDLAIQQSRGRFRYVLQDIREQITSGNSLGSAVRRHPHTFDPVLCELVSVGEQSGALQAVLKQGAEFRERQDRLKDRVLSAMLYPSLVLMLSVAVTIFLMTVVTPTLINSLQELQKELPLPTRILKSCSDFLMGWGIQIGVLILIVVFAGMIALQQTEVKRWRDRWLLRVPVLKTLIIKQNCSRLCMVTGTLLKSGVELVRALEIAQGAVINTVMADVVAQTRRKLASGTDLGTAIRTDGVFPIALVQVFTLGQNTGELEELLFQIAADYDHQVGMLADRLTTIMEPILIIGLSVIVGFILLATLLPILETGNVLSES